MSELERIVGLQETVAEVITRAIPAGDERLEGRLDTVARQLEQLRLATQGQAAAVGDNTQAIVDNTFAQVRGGTSAAGEVAKTASRWLGGGLSVTPLVSGLLRLFRGSKPEPPPALPVYLRPAALNLQATTSSSSGDRLHPVDYDQSGLPRRIQPPVPSHGPQVTVQIQAIDSQSFLDHRDQIARAVREAMLNAHSLNDVVNEW